MPRPSFNETITKLGYTKKNVETALLSLETRHFVKGPLPDKDESRPGHVYIFKMLIDDMQVYIKLKIDISKNGDKIAKCISFHEAEYSLH